MKLFTRDVFTPAVLTAQHVKCPSLLRLKWNFIGLMHHHKNGSPVRIDEASWRTVSGVVFRFRETALWVQFRHFNRDGI